MNKTPEKRSSESESLISELKDISLGVIQALVIVGAVSGFCLGLAKLDTRFQITKTLFSPKAEEKDSRIITGYPDPPFQPDPTLEKLPAHEPAYEFQLPANSGVATNKTGRNIPTENKLTPQEMHKLILNAFPELTENENAGSQLDDIDVIPQEPEPKEEKND